MQTKNLITLACHMEQGSNNLLAHQSIFSLKAQFYTRVLDLHSDTTVLALASAITSPSKERDLLTYNEPYVCGEAFSAVKRQIPFQDTTNRSYRRKMRPNKYKKNLRES